MQIEYSLHPELYLADETQESLVRPGLVRSQLAAGEAQIRDFSDKTRRGYYVALTEVKGSTDRLAFLEAFLDQTAFGISPFMIKIPVDRRYRDIYCGPQGDAVRTAFPLPIVDASDLFITAGDVPEDSAGYTAHDSANPIHDDQASPESGDTTRVEESISGGVLSVVFGFSKWGAACWKLAPGGAATNHNLGFKANDYLVACEASQAYKGVSYVFPTAASEDFRTSIIWYTAAKATISTSNGTGSTGTANAWNMREVDATSPANAAFAKVLSQRTTSASTDFYVDCLGLIPGQLDRWNFPSIAPGVIEFASAPSSGDRVKAAGSGKLVLPVRMQANGVSWSLVEIGHALVSGFEVLEFVE